MRGSLVLFLCVFVLAGACSADTTAVAVETSIISSGFDGKVIFGGPRFNSESSEFTVAGGLGNPIGDNWYSFTYFDVGGTNSGVGEEIIKFLKVPTIGIDFADAVLPDYVGPCAGTNIDFGTVEDSVGNDITYWTGAVGGVAAWQLGKTVGVAGYGRIQSNLKDDSYIPHVDVAALIYIRL